MNKLIGGGVCMFIGLFMLFGFLATPKEFSLIVSLMYGLLLIAAPIAGGGLLIRSHFTAKRKALQDTQKVLQEQQEREIIRLAQKKGGRLTIPEIAADTSLGTSEAEETMKEMTSKGYVDMQVTESGVIVYEFYEIAHRNSLKE